eukprot:CAMPEP_0116562104 /NCGR_PEP_ID=MMETSP0397-20121206/11970_1 /TAXON_ID=216820 /ORGANISM="Cyclophora tenuis, Strain ECT3854" /LENGTH=39 /DNA_ID= /DNA_START= /DNA_END= /DNA_ORIENTATION=
MLMGRALKAWGHRDGGIVEDDEEEDDEEESRINVGRQRL